MPIVECLLVALFIMIVNLCFLTWIYYLKSKAEWRELRAVRMVLAPEIVQAMTKSKVQEYGRKEAQSVNSEQARNVEFFSI